MLLHKRWRHESMPVLLDSSRSQSRVETLTTPGVQVAHVVTPRVCKARHPRGDASHELIDQPLDFLISHIAT